MTEEKPDSPDGIDWRLTTFDGHRREQLRRWAALSLEQIITAQEEMAALVMALHGTMTPYDFSRKEAAASVQERPPAYSGKSR